MKRISLLDKIFPLLKDKIMAVMHGKRDTITKQVKENPQRICAILLFGPYSLRQISEKGMNENKYLYISFHKYLKLFSILFLFFFLVGGGVHRSMENLVPLS